MKRSRHYGYLPLIIGVTALLVVFAAVSLPPYTTSEPTAEQAVQGAWQRARQVGVYRFATELEQTTYPAPSLANVGRSSRTDTLHMEGQINLPEHALLMSFWQGGGNVLDSRDGVEVRVEGDQSYGRAIGGGSGNIISGTRSTISGGRANTAGGPDATVVVGPATLVTYTTPATLPICARALVTATITDLSGNPVADGAVVTMSASIGLGFVESGGFYYYPTTVNGQVTATLLAGSLVGPTTTEAKCGSATSGPKTVNATRPGPATSVTLSAAPNTVAVGGNASTLTAIVRDCANDPVANGTQVALTMAPSLGPIAPNPATTSGGTAAATFTSGTTPGTAVVTATVGSVKGTTTVTVTPGAAYNVALTAAPTTLVANGSNTSTLTVTATDQYGNRAANGTVVSLTQSPTLGAIAPNPTTTGNGIARSTFTAGTISGTVTITASADGRNGVATISLIPEYFIYLPLVVRGYVSAPDLVVNDLVVTSASVQVVIQNRGTAPVKDEFWVDVYVAPQTAPTSVNQTWEQLGSQGLVWGVTADALPSLVPGGVLTLTVGDAYYWPGLSQVAWPLAVGTPVYAQVDSAHSGTTYGAVLETHEMTGGAYNNILGPIYSTSAASAAPAAASGEAGPAAEDSRLPRRP